MEWLSDPAGGYDLVAIAWHWALDRARAAGRSDAHTDAVSLVTSELVTNALMHAAGPVEVGVDTDAHDTRIEVWDASPDVDVHRTEHALDAGDMIGGWGLELVVRLSARWGTTVTGPRKCVWSEIES